MQDYGDTAFRPPALRPPTPPRNGRRWLVTAALALAFMFTLGVGAVVGANYLGTAQAAGSTPGNTTFGQTLASGPSAQRGQGQCGTLTVSSVNGSTIVAKASDGTSVTIHTSSSTKYTRAGAAASASAVTVGAQIHVDGARNSDGSINATSIDVR
jgi:Domain of unknown function (DUF5666)